MTFKFEDLTIKQLKALTEEFIKANPEFETAQDLLNQIETNKKDIFE